MINAASSVLIFSFHQMLCSGYVTLYEALTSYMHASRIPYVQCLGRYLMQAYMWPASDEHTHHKHACLLGLALYSCLDTGG